jgi:hypothetical protein
VTKSVLDALGKKPFHLVSGLNAAAFDAVFVAFSRNQGAVPADIADRFTALKADNEFRKTVGSSTTDVDTVKERIRLAEKHLFG